MKRLPLAALALALALAFAPRLHAQVTPYAPDTADLGRNPALARELIELGRVDQEVRAGLTPETVGDTAFVRRMVAADSASTARLREIVEAHGWPGQSLVGPAGAKAAFLLVQHSADVELQRRALALMEALPAGEVELASIAMLTDNLLVADGKPQRYGSSFQLVDGRLAPSPIEDPERVDERRARMGLPPLAEYARLLGEMYRASTSTEPARKP